MTVTEAEVKQIKSDFSKHLHANRKAATEKRRKVRNRYVVAVRNDEDLALVKQECMERFGVTPSHYEKIIANQYNDGTPKGDAITDAMIIVEMEKLQNGLNEVREWCDDNICRLDEAEESGETTYTVEVTEYSDGKGDDKTTTRKVPIYEARYLILERYVKASKHFFDVVGKLKGNQTLIQVHTGDRFANMTSSEMRKDLRARIQAEEKVGKIKDRVIIDD